jgi:multimeric flavodoxin WrbA
MNKKQKLSVLVLNASLKHRKDGTSNSEELAELVLTNMKKHGNISPEIIRLADKNIPVGLRFKESKNDDWPVIVKKLKAADIVIFATPIWWGGRSSLMQRIIERMDALDEEYIAGGRSALLNKVAGVVITGSEDGAQATLGSIMEVLTFMNFTLPPECCAYWVGEVGQPPKDDSKKRRKNKATIHMAASLARNLMYYAYLLRTYPLVIEE